MRRFFEFFRVASSVKQLSNSNDIWDDVYRNYLTCVWLIVSITVLKYLTDLLVCMTLLMTFAHVITHSEAMKAFATPPFFRWLASVI